MNTLSRVLISGATGLIGSTLVRSLSADQISVTRLVRRRSGGPSPEICWSPLSSMPIAELSELEEFDAVIHLSGANLARRWTSAYKNEIVESRVRTTQVLSELLAGLRNPPKVLLCASAIGFYGNRGDEILTETSKPGSGFLAETCLAWETATQPLRDVGIRVVNLRFGVVLSPEGGALAKMLPLFRLGLGGRLGSGQQWMSWISLPDLVRAVSSLTSASSVTGAVNIVAPNPVTNAEFTQTLTTVLHRSAVIPAPAFALRIAMGEMADEALLASARVIPARLTQSGFSFQHGHLASALESLLHPST